MIDTNSDITLPETQDEIMVMMFPYFRAAFVTAVLEDDDSGWIYINRGELADKVAAASAAAVVGIVASHEDYLRIVEEDLG